MTSFERKKHISWKNLPSFFDVSGSVSVATFGARRLPEIKALWSQTEQQETQLPCISVKSLQSGGGKTSSRHLRRRTTSYKRRIRHRFPAAEKPTSESQCRRSRRRRRHLLESQHTQPAALSDEPSMSQPVNWIANHVWHAKRFHMSNLWGWRVPMLHVNRGAKAALRLAQERTLVQEATWSHQPVVCSGLDFRRLAEAVQRVVPSFSMTPAGDVQVGRGIAYEIDSFPKYALGPITWMVTMEGNLFDGVDSASVVLFVHPCIQLSVVKQLGSIDGLNASIHTKKKFCCLRLRGFQPENCLKKALLQQISPDLQTKLESFLINSSVSHSDAIQLKNADKTQSDVVIVREATHDASLPSNLGVVGFDIYCLSSMAKTLFQSLVVTGGAAPIGLTEGSHLLQEAHPPVPLFPRDWPDTPSGVIYWQSDGAWNILRTYLEGGTGRVDRRTPPQCSIEWSQLVEQKGNEEEIEVVVVRGTDFGKPFDDALVTSGSSYQNHEMSGELHRRPRRKSNGPAFVRVPKLSADFAESFQGTCNSLVQSLTLPALLVCHITVFGKGVIKPNDRVFSCGEDIQAELGIVTSGIFSPSRGHFHGIAVIGASRFLSDVAAAVSSGSSTFAVRECDGTRSIQHGVSIRRGDESLFGTLSLLL